jgi:hypothetical protein
MKMAVTSTVAGREVYLNDLQHKVVFNLRAVTQS